MEQGVKLKLGVVLLLAQIVLYYYFPKNGVKNVESATHGDFCRVSPAEKVCVAPISAILELCPLPKFRFVTRPVESKNDQRDVGDTDDNDDDQISGENPNKMQGEEKIEKEKRQNTKEETRRSEEKHGEMSAEEKRTAQEEKASSLIYQIMVVLLVVSVGVSLADCFRERSKRKNNPDAPTNARGEPILNRRMSLADLTMQRHARRESQVQFKPPDSRQAQEAFMGRRSSSTESPKTTKQKPNRQKSCPAPFLRRLSTVDLLDGKDAQDATLAWAERRRVRMIQRH